MLDITKNTYWVDENKTPLSVLEIRNKTALNEFCIPVESGDKSNYLQELKDKNIGNFRYAVKNMVRPEYSAEYTLGESKNYYISMPQNIPTEYEALISKNAIECPPVK